MATGCNLRLRLLGINTHVVVCAKNDLSNLNLYMIYHLFNFDFLGFSIPFLHSLHMFQSFCRHERVKPCVEVSTKSKGAISNIRCIFAWRKEMYPNNQLYYLQMDLDAAVVLPATQVVPLFPLTCGSDKVPSPPFAQLLRQKKLVSKFPFWIWS